MSIAKTTRWESSDDEEDHKSKHINKKSKKRDVEETKHHKHSSRQHHEKHLDKEHHHHHHSSNNDHHHKQDRYHISPSSPVARSATSSPRQSPRRPSTSYNPLLQGCRSIENYQRLNFIDQGTYGMVFRAKCLDTNEIVAIKQVKMDASSGSAGFPITALREINILLSLRHPNIVHVKEMVVGSSIDKIYMVMEYLENDLKACMDMSSQPFSIAEVKRLMLQLLGAVQHMHAAWYIHRDLKTSNLLYSNKGGKLCVCDFGMARKFSSPISPYTHEVITLWYRCPELLLGARKYSTPVDMWSVGCIFAEFLLRKPLLPGEGEIDQISKIFKLLGNPTEEQWPGYSILPHANNIPTRLPHRDRFRDLFPATSFAAGSAALSSAGIDLLSKLLHMCPEKRISATDALSHPWFTEEPRPMSEQLMPKFKSKFSEKESSAVR